MKFEKLKKWLTLNYEISEEADQIMVRYRELFNEHFGANERRTFDDACKFVHFDRATNGMLHYKGWESGAFGGTGYHEMTLPLNYLVDPQWELKVIEQFQFQIETHRLQKARELQVQQERDRAEFLRLAERYQDALKK